MNKVAIVLLTYAEALDSPRHEYAKRTLCKLREYVHYSGSIRWHIADDGSPSEHIEALQAIRTAQGEKYHESITNAERRGYGASYNLATQSLHDDCHFLLMVEDDWELTRPLDLDPLIQTLEERDGCIRLGYLGFTQEIRGTVRYYAKQAYLELDPNSPEPHVWSGHPRLETREFQRRVGPWPEGLNPGATEFEVAHRLEARKGILWPLDLGARASQIQGTLFAHIGAQQARSDQR